MSESAWLFYLVVYLALCLSKTNVVQVEVLADNQKFNVKYSHDNKKKIIVKCFTLHIIQEISSNTFLNFFKCGTYILKEGKIIIIIS